MTSIFNQKSRLPVVIKFICPNGHQLSAPSERAGKPGKCPKCATEFVVPELAEFGPPDAEDTDSVETAGGGPAPRTEEEIVFLCPNGHKLNGPASLMGKPGQCPQCGSKFRIPDETEDDDTPEVESQHDDIPTGELVEDDEGPSEPVEQVAEVEAIEQATADVEDLPLVEPVFDEPLPPPTADGSSALADIVGMLWHGHAENQVMEIHLENKMTLVAKSFSPVLSRQTHGVFAIADGDSAHTIIAIPWESVARIEFPQVGKLREDLFE